MGVCLGESRKKFINGLMESRHKPIVFHRRVFLNGWVYG